MDAAIETGMALDSARLLIDLGALADNWRSVAALAPASETSAVVKADAYGTGVGPAAKALLKAGCRTFFVATPAEGAELRSLSSTAAIYVLDGLPTGAAPTFHQHALRPVLGTVDEIAEWVAWRNDGGKGEAAVHFDTGMNRLGLTADEATALAGDASLREALGPFLVVSHLACADEPGHPANVTQLNRFRAITAAFPGMAASLANSAGVQLGADYQFAVTRPGILLYGGQGSTERPPLRPVVTAEARVLSVREAPTGAVVGYGATERLRRPSRLATLGAGYADGYHRMAGSTDQKRGASVFLSGRRAPLVGRVSMDLMVADVTDIPGVMRGDWAELFGENILIDEVAGHAATIAYELLTGLGPRYARRYVHGG